MATNGRTGAIVLCGGRSTRMGRDKAALRFGPESLIERMLRLVGEVTPHIVVAAAEGQVVPSGPVASRDRSAGTGPLPALLDALDHLDTDLVCVVACDMPLLRPALLPALVNWCNGWDAAVPLVGKRLGSAQDEPPDSAQGRPLDVARGKPPAFAQGKRVPTCAAYRREALLAARGRLGDPRHKSLHALLDLLRVREVTEDELRGVDPGLLSFTPCNTEEEYERALRLAGGE